MRRIPTDNFELPTGWQADATAALAEVQKFAAASRKDRNEEIERHAPKTWRALKHKLMDLSKDKCWYCEIRQDRSLGEVDHFRPKGKVFGLPNHPGYWWLAFESTNFRYSCNFCNRRTVDRQTSRTGGKHEQFPIESEATRALKPGDNHDLEKPLLLDPLRPGDPGMLTWQINGDPAPRFPLNKLWLDKADTSIAVYHLHHYKIRRRRRKIYNDLKLLVKEGDALYGKAALGQTVQQESLDRLTSSIIEMIGEAAELSAAANQYLMEFKMEDPAKRTWIDAVVSAA